MHDLADPHDAALGIAVPNALVQTLVGFTVGGCTVITAALIDYKGFAAAINGERCGVQLIAAADVYGRSETRIFSFHSLCGLTHYRASRSASPTPLPASRKTAFRAADVHRAEIAARPCIDNGW
jgi:hypothetical protein